MVGPARLTRVMDNGDEGVWGTFELHLGVSSGFVTSGVLFSDCLLPAPVTLFNERLKSLKESSRSG